MKWGVVNLSTDTDTQNVSGIKKSCRECGRVRDGQRAKEHALCIRALGSTLALYSSPNTTGYLGTKLSLPTHMHKQETKTKTTSREREDNKKKNQSLFFIE